MSNWLSVCAVDEIATNRSRATICDGVNVAVFRVEDGAFYAIEDRCPHRGAALSRGLLYDGNKVACLDHGWGICLVDGKVEAPQTGRVRTFQVKVEDGMVWLKA